MPRLGLLWLDPGSIENSTDFPKGLAACLMQFHDGNNLLLTSMLNQSSFADLPAIGDLAAEHRQICIKLLRPRSSIDAALMFSFGAFWSFLACYVQSMFNQCSIEVSNFERPKQGVQTMGCNQNKVRLDTIAAKIFAIGELIKFRGGEPSLEEERVNYGIGEILTELAGQLTNVD